MDCLPRLPFGFKDAAQFAAARRLLLEADYTPAGIASALQRDSVLSVQDSDLPVHLHRTRGGTPCEILIRLFLLEQPVAEEAIRGAIGTEIESWIEAGLLTRTADSIASTVKLLPYENLVLAADRATAIREGAADDFVMSVGHATELLAFMAVPARGGDTLDIGCGCGAVALLAAADSGKVMASDIAPRSIAFTQFNAQLNAITNVEAVAGDMFAPAEQSSFDRILCNPPFVISPQARYIFRDSGRRGDQFCRELVRAAPPLLNEGGYFQLIANIPHIAGQDWRADWQQWFTGLGCDAIVWANETSDIADYAATWIRDTETKNTGDHVARFDEWMDYYQSQQIEAVTYGVINLRKRSGDNFVLIDDTARTVAGPCGDQVERAFHLEDYWRKFANDRELLDQTFVVSSNVSLLETRESIDTARFTVAGTEIRLTGSVTTEADLDPASVALIEKCDGRLSVRQIIPSIAARFNVPEENLAGALPKILASLARRGYLNPVV